MTYYVGADIGTSSVKLLLIDAQGNPCAKREERYALSSPQPGWLEIDPEVWVSAVMRGLTALIAHIDRRAVRGIGFTGQMHTTVFLDQDGKSIRPAISWNDTRTADQVKWLKKQTAGSEPLRRIGRILSTGSPAVNLLWLRQNEPEHFSRLHMLLIGPDYLTYRFSGVFGTDYCEASTSSLFDVSAKCWSSEMCRLVGVSESVLAPVYGAGVRVGRLRTQIAEQLELPQEVEIIAGTGDNPATYLSSGQLHGAAPMISLGTSGILMFSRAKEQEGAKGKPILFSLDGTEFCVIVQGAVQSTGSSFHWWAKDILQGKCFDAVSDLVDCNQPVSKHLLFYPHLAGEKTIHADPYLRGAFIGIGTDTTQAGITRSIFEGIGFAFRQLMEKMHVGRQLRSIKVTGGMSCIGAFMQILADILNVCVEVSENIGAAQGIALLAAHSCGESGIFEQNAIHPKQVFQPRKAFVKTYDEKYRIYTRIYRSLKQIYIEE